MIRCTVGVFAHNEAQNVRQALHAILAQQLHDVTVVEIIVLASGCTDNTVELAEEIARANPIVRVAAESHRTGKAAAIKRLMAVAQGEVIVFVGADTLPSPTALERLLQPFSDPAVGMTGARVVPLNAPTRFIGFAVQMLWNVHHHLALRKPKLGELVASRNVVTDFPEDTGTDEPALEALITRRGYRLVYTPKAVVYNRGPENLREFFVQRRRIFAGEVLIALKYRYLVSSLSLRHVLPVAADAIRIHPQRLHWTIGVMALELCARLLGALDAARGRTYAVWRHAPTTKDVLAPAERGKLVMIRWAPGAVDGTALLTELRGLPESVGSVFSSDPDMGEVLLRLDVGESTLEWLERRLLTVQAQRSSAALSPSTPSISCRLVHHAPASSSPLL